jgi:hypothetical protein
MAVQEPSAEALTLADEIRHAWTAFATHGDPGWPAYQADQRLTRLLDANPSTAPCPKEHPDRSGTDTTSIRSPCFGHCGLSCLADFSPEGQRRRAARVVDFDGRATVGLVGHSEARTIS